jgi:hypothetical protein
MLRREDRGSVAVLHMDHGKANALDVELIGAIGDALGDIVREGSHSAVVLTGTGSIFSAGVDLFRFLEGGESYLEQFFDAMVRSFRALFAFPRPLVAAVNGHAIAGGAVMAAAADYRIMSMGKAKIGVPELRVGIPFPVAAIEILRFATSTQHLQELVYLGRASCWTERCTSHRAWGRCRPPGSASRSANCVRRRWTAWSGCHPRSIRRCCRAGRRPRRMRRSGRTWRKRWESAIEHRPSAIHVVATLRLQA